MIQNDDTATCATPADVTTFAVALLGMSSAEGTFVSVAFAAQPRGEILDVTVKSGRVSLDARGAALADVLAAMGRQAGVKVVLRDALTTLVTARLVNVPLEEAFSRLGRWHSIAFIYDRSTESADRPALSELWVSCLDHDWAGASSAH
jgi:hypothetical protein